ncbi:MAG: SipW-dependent-type signal peptide-containing protein, partial [Bacilli bacterium]|nr:SipW-dependent-type signal peptide-containing protein [Bacilli bacterium]
MKNKKNLLLIVGIILLGVGGTLAYYRSTSTFDNQFNTSSYKTVA